MEEISKLLQMLHKRLISKGYNISCLLKDCLIIRYMIYLFIMLIFLACLKKYNPYVEKSQHQIDRRQWDERLPLIKISVFVHQDHIKNQCAEAAP